MSLALCGAATTAAGQDLSLKSVDIQLSVALTWDVHFQLLSVKIRSSDVDANKPATT
jgi:hypothetical protein